jgi:biofilm protein TabA
MIISLFKINGKQIFEGNKYFRKIYDLISQTDFSKISDGLHEIDKNTIFYNIISYETKNYKEIVAESHKKYIDIHYILNGEEIIGYSDYKNEKTIAAKYNIEKDAELFSNILNENFFVLKRGMFAIFYPQEIHRPGMLYEKKCKVRKIIFKIKV